ncbi:hypothetical protein PS639_06083 [Pseudomonas fluorescens]|nr:hypothetical protein PS639_06083 [Pseudomonas fluorescens]
MLQAGRRHVGAEALVQADDLLHHIGVGDIAEVARAAAQGHAEHRVAQFQVQVRAAASAHLDALAGDDALEQRALLGGVATEDFHLDTGDQRRPLGKGESLLRRVAILQDDGRLRHAVDLTADLYRDDAVFRPQCHACRLHREGGEVGRAGVEFGRAGHAFTSTVADKGRFPGRACARCRAGSPRPRSCNGPCSCKRRRPAWTDVRLPVPGGRG